MSDAIDFWFSFGSLYSYLSIMRIGDVARQTGVTIRWRPFSVRTIMVEMDNIPAKKPIKLAYSWRDVERRAVMYGIGFTARPPYPLKNSDLGNRIATLAAGEGWCAEFTRAAYWRWFQDGQEAGSEPNNSAALRDIGQEPERVLAQAEAPEIVRAYQAATDEARALGIFGSPTFVARGELFWGDDRLADAIAWNRSGTLAAR